MRFLAACAVAGASALVAGAKYVLKRRKGGAMDCLHEQQCPCYGQGFSDGKDKAHFELQSHIRAQHDGGCGCAKCVTIRAILTPMILREAEAAVRSGHGN